MKLRTPPFKVIVCDPPWSFDDKLGKRGAAANYTTERVEWIKAYKLPPTADDCVLFLWRVATQQEEACQVARAWGFNPTKGELVWRKLTPTGKEHFGMGYILRGAHESCLVATRGRPPVLRHDQRSIFSAAVPRVDGKISHSGKPDEFFRIVASLYDGPRASVFERTERAGFTCFGDQMRRG